MEKKTHNLPNLLFRIRFQILAMSCKPRKKKKKEIRCQMQRLKNTNSLLPIPSDGSNFL